MYLNSKKYRIKCSSDAEIFYINFNNFFEFFKTKFACGIFKNSQKKFFNFQNLQVNCSRVAETFKRIFDWFKKKKNSKIQIFQIFSSIHSSFISLIKKTLKKKMK